VHLSAPYECLAMDLREGLNSLGLITGETTPDEILDHIFSRFCIGK
jgi:tRNA modification GTPase